MNTHAAQFTIGSLGGGKILRRQRTPARVRSGAAHALLVEYGTVRTSAQPYLEPSAMGTMTEQLQAAGREARIAFATLAAQLAGPPDSITKQIWRLSTL